jgi:hypothetical protein
MEATGNRTVLIKEWGDCGGRLERIRLDLISAYYMLVWKYHLEPYLYV